MMATLVYALVFLFGCLIGVWLERARFDRYSDILITGNIIHGNFESNSIFFEWDGIDRRIEDGGDRRTGNERRSMFHVEQAS